MMYELIIVLGLIAAFLAGQQAQAIGVSLGLLDDPKAEAHKAHVSAVPQVGSVLLFAGLIAIGLAAFLYGPGEEFIPIIFCASLVGALGIIDDRLKLSWVSRFLALWLIIGVMLVLAPELLITSLHWSWGQTSDLGTIGGYAFTALCLVGLVIALNMMDGFNGGILSQGIVWSLAFAFLTTGDNTVVFLAITATLFVILYFNMPSKLFMGDGGAYALGLVMGASAIMMYGSQTNATVYADTIVVWLALPVFDCLRVIFRRKLRGESPFLPQRDHLHHLLMKSVHPQAGLVFSFLYTASASLAAILKPEASYIIVVVQLLTLTAVVTVTSSKPKAVPSNPAE
ncbi:glycosyltransferase family 4 protein [Kordiimonas sp.]|uniref:glycosyltransferase family 4 protein n=1 Tax=Kordiimonas sp. TaxID=1970157 RepID=UPI003A959B42